MTAQLVQAYQQAPWRTRVQRIATVLLVVVLVGLIAGVYLYISSKSAEAGMTMWKYEREITQAKLRIVDLQNQLADLTAYTRMEDEAQKMGYHRLGRNEADFILAPGFYGRTSPIFFAHSGARSPERIVIRPAYTESLMEWLLKKYSTLLAEIPLDEGAQ